MRISMKRDDPGFIEGPLGITTYLNGKKVTKVLTADEELGLVVVHKTDEDGRYQITHNIILEETLRGHVRIDLPDDHPLRNMWREKQARQAEANQLDPFRAAVQERFDLLHIPMPSDPREAIEALVKAETAIALSPEVSELAEALVQRGRDEAHTDSKAVYQLRKADGSWIDQTACSYDYNVKHGATDVRKLYTLSSPEHDQD